MLPAGDVDIEPLEGRKQKEDSLLHGKVKCQFASVIDSGLMPKLSATQISWANTNNKAEDLLDIRFKPLGNVQVPVSRLLRQLEQRIIAEPMAALGWRIELSLEGDSLLASGESIAEPVMEYADWPRAGVEDAFQQFKHSRESYLQSLGQDGSAKLSVAHDFSETTVEAKEYARSYMEYLLAVNACIESADAEHSLDGLVPLLQLDGVSITLRTAHEQARQAVLLGPTHPLRVMWLSGWSQLGEYWLKMSAKLSKELVVGTRNGLCNELALTNFPYVLPRASGQIFVAIDNIHPFWTVYGATKESEPQLLVDAIAKGLGVQRPVNRQATQHGDYLSAKVERYLVQHPYVQTLVINVFNGGNGTVVADMLLALERRKDLKHIRYDIRLFVTDPYGAGVGCDLLALLDSDASDAISEAATFSQAAGHHLHSKLAISIKSIKEFAIDIAQHTAHLSLLFDVFPAEDIAIVEQAADERVAPVHGLYQDYCVEYCEENGIVTWDRYTRHGNAKPVFGSDFTEPLSKLPQLMANLTAAVATGVHSGQKVPVVRLSLKASDRALLNQLHEVSDWVFTVDRNLGIEFFDHGGQVGRPDYLIDHSPEMAANNGHSFVITSRSTTEVQALLNDTLERFQLAPDAAKATRVLEALRALSGRLALKLVSSSASKTEALGLALAKMYLDYQGIFAHQIIVPLDAHLELYQELQKNADELGDSLSLKRTDLALFDFDVANRILRCHLIEVKCYSDVGDLASYNSLKESIAQQILQSERVLQQHFDPYRTSPDRPDRLVRTQKLCVLLEHYLKRSMRFGLLEAEVFEEAKFFLRTFEEGYRLLISRNAIVFDFGQDGTGVESEVGIDYHRIGREHIIELINADTYTLQNLRAEPTDDFGRSPVECSTESSTELSLSSIELSLPKLTHAQFIPKDRDRTISWDDIASVSFTRSQENNLQPEPLEDGECGEVEIIENSQARSTSHSIGEPDVSAELVSTTMDAISMPESLSTPKQDDAENTASPTEEDEKMVPDDVAYNIMLGVNGVSKQYGLLGEVSGHKVALDLNHTHTISLFGVQGGGKSYTLGTVVEMATAKIPAINSLSKELASVIFHYSATQDYKPEFTSMIAPNDNAAQMENLKRVYGAEPTSLKDVVLLTPVEKLEVRRQEYPGINVQPLMFCSAELQVAHWKFLMGAVGNQAAYIRQLSTIMRRNRNNLTLDSIRNGVANSRLSDPLKDLANMRLDFAEQYIDDSLSISTLIKPGSMIIVDLRDEFIEKDEALGLFVVLLQIFSEAKYQGQSFNKLVVFDECHKYIDSADLVKGLVETVREMRHNGTSVMIASQDPPSVPIELIELSSQIILHKFNSPAWLKHIQKANAALGKLTAEKLANLNAGEAYVWSSKASDQSFTKEAFKVRCRPRATKHGGDTVTAIA